VSAAAGPAIAVDDLRVVYRTPMRRRRVVAVDGMSFRVERGEIFGFLGPNGAGKTTTMRILMGLVRATAGTCRVLGEVPTHRKTRHQLGFLPETPYFYDYLKVGELLDLAGRLHGLSRKDRARRAEELIERVGLDKARKVPMRKFSKGMLQRAGIAQALINDPALVVFDEPMSGLDPIGRKEVRDIIRDLGAAGKTGFFSTHILPDVESVCDRIAMVVRGKIRDVGEMSDLVESQLLGTEVTLRLGDADAADAAIDALEEHGPVLRRAGREVTFSLAAAADVDSFLARSRDLGASVVSVAPRQETLEDVFVRTAGANSVGGTFSA